MRRVGIGAGCLAACLVIGLAGFQAQGQESGVPRIVRDIRIEGNVNVSEEEIRQVIGLTTGVDLNLLAVRRQLSNDIRAIAELGYFDEFGVSVAEENLPDGVRVVYEVSERPLIRDVEIEGNDVYIKNDKRLRNEMGYKRGDRVFLTDEFIAKCETALRDYYKKKGFPLVNPEDVTHSVRELDTGEVILVIHVVEGKKRKITGVFFQDPTRPGQPLHFTEKQLRKRVKTRKSWWFIHRRLDDTKTEQDLAVLERLYRSEGYLDVVLERGDIEGDPENPHGMFVWYDITEGTQYRLRDLKIAGNSLFSSEEIRQAITAVPGEPLDEIKFRYTDDIPAVRNLYYGQGYMNARVNADYAKSTTEGVVDVTLGIREEERVRLNDIIIRGVVFDPDSGSKIEDQVVEDFKDDRGRSLFKTKRFVIERELNLERGDIIDWGEVKAAERRLQNLGYFERFDPFRDTGFSVAATEDPGKMNLVLRAEERKTGQISFGGGWSSVFGFSAFVGLREENFFGRGQIFDINLEVGERRQSYRASFTEPRFLGSEYLLGFDAFNTVYKSIGSRDFEEERLGGAIRTGRKLSDRWSAGLQLKYEDVTISDIADADIVELPQIYEDAEGSQTTISTIGSITYNSLDYSPRPRRGMYNVFTTQLAGMGGDNEFAKFLAELNWYHPAPFWDKLVFAARQEFGVATAYGGTEDVPLQDRFFEGGSNSVRGFETYSLGPKGTIRRTFWERNARGEFIRDIETGEPIVREVDEDEVNLGGEFKSVTNLELRYRIIDMLELAYFVDAGYAWEDVSAFDPTDLRFSTGVSLKLDLPIGIPLRFDLGFPLNPKSGDDEEIFTFSFYRQFR